jgi:hypothetical protein
MRAKCKRCVFFELDTWDEDWDTAGFCHRFPPSNFRGDGLPEYVKVFDADWCGEWRADIKEGDLQQHTTNKARQPRKLSGKA